MQQTKPNKKSPPDTNQTKNEQLKTRLESLK